ncbi:MerR family transcriptional regulator [Pseudomonas sp. Irchel s3h17]|uniref:MerR family transcriptional regulator n=1 Tax=Pseudomonas sp. Irchel s3h17 TaxID=2009182 RepID=UPI000BA38080|nr:MerR family transcriptional regulator [Pseudomonas sp. Irchel s3h17]
MYIGKAAKLSGTTIKSIRHYEDIGLLPPAQRQGKYRIYDQHTVDLLSFIKCAQQLGFKLKEMQVMLQDHRDQTPPWDLALQAIIDKKQQLADSIVQLTQQHQQLSKLQASLAHVQQQCPLERV